MPYLPTRAPVIDGPTPCSAYTLERKLLRAYSALYERDIASIWHPATRLAAQVTALGGLDRAATRKGYAENRLREVMPEVIQRLTLEQQPLLAAVLLKEAACLADVVALLVKCERHLNYRDEDPRLNVNDDARLKAAGMGKLSRQQYEYTKPKYAHLGPPLELTPWVPKLRTAKKKKAGRPRPRWKAQCTASRYAQEQLCFAFYGGGITLACL